MLVHLRVISMFVFAFVLVFLASSNYEIYSRSPEKSREAKNSTLRVDQKSVISNTEMKTYFPGEVKQIGSRARANFNTARVASHLDSNVAALIMEFGTGEGHAPRQTYGSRKFASPRSSSTHSTPANSDVDGVVLNTNSVTATADVTDSGYSGEGLFVVYGPVQGAEGPLLNVLGQQFDLSGLDVSSLDLSSAVGRSAYVEAQQVGETLNVTRIELFDEYPVPGASPVLVVGNVTEVDSTVGRVLVGNLEIDTTTMGTDLRLKSGQQFSVPGTQPVPGGLILGGQQLVADSNLIGALDSSEVVSISGSSARGISGSSARGISGSSARGISGSSARGISGSSARGISGSSVR